MSATSPPPVFSDRYELVRHIARGGMAQVYLARDTLLDRAVALKVLFPELSVDQSFVKRFRGEAQAAASLSHPNIVSIYDWGQGESTYCIVMEYVDGRTLSALVRDAPLDAHRAAGIGADVAAALEFAHSNGVIHRDVKPGNVLIDANGRVKVADFGIARAVGAKEALTQTGAVMGTATYFSPEQAQGYPVDARSDVYSLGVVLYEIVTGTAPFTGDNAVAIAYKHVREDAPALRSVDASIPADYEAIVGKAMAKRAEDRYQSAAEMQADLERFLAGQPVEAAVVSTVAVAAMSETRQQTTAIPFGVAGAGGLAAGGLAAGGLAGAGLADVDYVRGAGGAAWSPTEVGGPDGTATGPPDNDIRRYVVLALVMAAVLAVLVFFLGRSLGWWGATSAPSAVIPRNIVGMTVPDATTDLNRAGFANLKSTSEASSQLASGEVITTQPAPGTRARTSKLVVLVVSTGAPTVNVPDVTGQPIDIATNMLDEAGFKPTVTMKPSDSVASGLVISTDPAGNQPAAQGSVVTVVESSGRSLVTIPPLSGENQVNAGAKLAALGLSVVPASVANALPAGQVTGTNPPAGTTVDPGTTVTVYVSTGPPRVSVPDLSGGLTQSAASAALSGANLMGAFTAVAVNDPALNGIVTGQSPSPGASVAPGSTVQVTVGSYTAAPTTTSTTLPSPTTSTPKR